MRLYPFLAIVVVSLVLQQSADVIAYETVACMMPYEDSLKAGLLEFTFRGNEKTAACCQETGQTCRVDNKQKDPESGQNIMMKICVNMDQSDVEKKSLIPMEKCCEEAGYSSMRFHEEARELMDLCNK